MDLEKIKMADIAQEIAILNRYPHHNIMNILDHFSTPTHYCMIYEFQSRVSLFEYLRISGQQDDGECGVILRHVLAGLGWLHHNKIVHGDLKDENMVIEPRTRKVVLIDFGSARMIAQRYEPLEFRGTRIYSPPEAVGTDLVFGLSADVWTVGTFVYVVLSNRRPFQDEAEIVAGGVVYPASWSQGARDLVGSCLSSSWADRPSVTELKHHPWVQFKS